MGHILGGGNDVYVDNNWTKGLRNIRSKSVNTLYIKYNDAKQQQGGVPRNGDNEKDSGIFETEIPKKCRKERREIVVVMKVMQGDTSTVDYASRTDVAA